MDFEDTLWVRDPRERTFAYTGEGDEQAGEEKSAEIPKDADDALKVVGKLAEDGRNEVWLLSGLARGALEVVVQTYPKVGLV